MTAPTQTEAPSQLPVLRHEPHDLADRIPETMSAKSTKISLRLAEMCVIKFSYRHYHILHRTQQGCGFSAAVLAECWTFHRHTSLRSRRPPNLDVPKSGEEFAAAHKIQVLKMGRLGVRP